MDAEKMAREKLADPTQYACGYSLDLYCDHYHYPGNLYLERFIGETFGECVRDARARGWIVRTRTRTATCPYCATAIRAKAKEG